METGHATKLAVLTKIQLHDCFRMKVPQNAARLWLISRGLKQLIPIIFAKVLIAFMDKRLFGCPHSAILLMSLLRMLKTA